MGWSVRSVVFLKAIYRTLQILNTLGSTLKAVAPDDYGSGRVSEARSALESFCTTIKTVVRPGKSQKIVCSVETK